MPSSSTSVGIFDNGLSFISSACGLAVSATVRTHVIRSAMPRSCATIMTLRTNGERGDQCSFMNDPRDRFSLGFWSRDEASDLPCSRGVGKSVRAGRLSRIVVQNAVSKQNKRGPSTDMASYVFGDIVDDRGSSVQYLVSDFLRKARIPCGPQPT